MKKNSISNWWVVESHGERPNNPTFLSYAMHYSVVGNYGLHVLIDIRSRAAKEWSWQVGADDILIKTLQACSLAAYLLQLWKRYIGQERLKRTHSMECNRVVINIFNTFIDGTTATPLATVLINHSVFLALYFYFLLLLCLFPYTVTKRKFFWKKWFDQEAKWALS